MAKTTNDYFVPVKNITDGAIILDNNHRVTGIKIMPKNIFILDQDAQDMTISSIKNVYNMIDYEFWIIAADRPVDIDLYLSELQLHYNSLQNTARRKMIMEDINKANMFMSNNVVDTEYYLLFKEKDAEVCRKRVNNLINYFGVAGLNAHQTTNEDLRIILDNFLNGGTTTGFGTVIS
jgi:hypothetical protein